MFDSLMPVWGDSFLPRVEERRLLELLRRPSPACSALVGLPGAGKSSLLHQLQYILSGEFNVGMVSLGHHHEVNDEVLCRGICEAIGCAEPTLNALSARITNADRRTILLIDDFDRVAETVTGAFLARLRAVVTGRALGKVAIVTASTRPLYEICEAVRGSALYNVFLTVPVGSFSLAELDQCVALKARFNDLKPLYAASAGFAGTIVRLAFSEWEADKPGPLEAFDVIAAALRSLSPLERMVLRELALAEDPTRSGSLAPADRLAYLKAVGIIRHDLSFSGSLFLEAARTAISLNELEKIKADDSLLVLFRRLELALREVVRKGIREDRIPSSCFKDVLDDKQYAALQSRRSRLRFAVDPDLCDASYLSETGLVIKRFYGALSSDIAVKKREFDAMFEILAPGRNEQYHHNYVPPVEEDRARVAIRDLLTAIKH